MVTAANTAQQRRMVVNSEEIGRTAARCDKKRRGKARRCGAQLSNAFRCAVLSDIPRFPAPPPPPPPPPTKREADKTFSTIKRIGKQAGPTNRRAAGHNPSIRRGDRHSCGPVRSPARPARLGWRSYRSTMWSSSDSESVRLGVKSSQRGTRSQHGADMCSRCDTMDERLPGPTLCNSAREFDGVKREVCYDG